MGWKRPVQVYYIEHNDKNYRNKVLGVLLNIYSKEHISKKEYGNQLRSSRWTWTSSSFQQHNGQLKRKKCLVQTRKASRKMSLNFF